MEEWEERLKGKQPGKMSAVERIIEKSEEKNKKTCQESRPPPGPDNSPCIARIRKMEQFRQRRPKSLDLSERRAESPSNFQYLSKEKTEEELSDGEGEKIGLETGCSSVKSGKLCPSRQL